MDDFILHALLAGAGAALISAPLGCFVVWRRMAYFSDSLAHSTLLGVALGLLLGVSQTLAAASVCLCFAALLLWIERRRTLAADTILGILAHSALAAGIVALSFSGAVNMDLHHVLFGDVLTVSRGDLIRLYVGGAAALAVLVYCWQPLLLITASSDLAAAEGVPVFRMRIVLIVLMAITVAVSIRIIGALLIASLLIIPAASARLIARSPEGMAALAAVFGVTAAVSGLALSLQFDVPAGPGIVCAAAALFALTAALSPLLRRG